MSITDIATGRMPFPRVPRAFGARRMTPARPRPVSRIDWDLVRARLDAVQARCLAHLGMFALWLRRSMLALSFERSEARLHEAAMRAILQSDFSATCARVLAYAGALALLAVVSAQLFRAAPAATAAEPVAQAEWIDVAKPFPAFALPMPELANSGYGYGMRRHATGGGRRDIMSWGELEGDAPHLMVEIYRPGGEFTPFGTAEDEIVARTDGLIDATAIAPVGEMDSKFGSVALVEFTLKSKSMRQCLGFARAYDRPRLEILGWYCSSGSEWVERDLAACALDRLTLMAAGSDPKVGELFARAELKRTFCGQRSPIIAATPRLGPSAAPVPDMKLRGRIAAH